jgi:hypothetical protein
MYNGALVTAADNPVRAAPCLVVLTWLLMVKNGIPATCPDRALHRPAFSAGPVR